MPTTLSPSKPHFPILDGLRGTAALLVVAFHLLEAWYPVMADHPMHHGFLAVDFFFLLSGFVVGYAYDDRWTTMTVMEFFKIRLIRLHPLVILGMVVGALGFWLDPYTNNPLHLNLFQVTGVMLIGCTLIPSPDIRGWGETHSLDGPCWSLLQEYIANILYALVVRKLSIKALAVLVALCAVVLTLVANWRGDVATGWSYETFWIAVVRMMFPFFAGLLLFRSKKLLRIPMPYLLCSLALTALFFAPTFQRNGLYEAACIIIAFPVVVAAGAGGIISGRWAKLCKFSGDISYPIYILHYPFIYIYTAWIYVKKPAASEVIPVAIGLFIFFIVMAYAALKLYDEKIRLRLKQRFLSR